MVWMCCGPSVPVQLRTSLSLGHSGLYSIAMTRLFDVFEPLQAHLNVAEVLRIRRLNREFLDGTDWMVGWKSRAIALKCQRLKVYSRVALVNYVTRTKTRCHECGGQGARLYRHFKICDACKREARGYRQLASRKDIRRTWDLTPYRTMLLSRKLKSVHGGYGVVPFLYWACDVNRVYREEYGRV